MDRQAVDYTIKYIDDAHLEMKDEIVDELFDQLLNEKSIDQMIKEDILSDKFNRKD